MTASITRILVPVDFSTPADRAVRYATTLAGRFGASVELLHVVEDPFLSGAWNTEAYIPNLVELRESIVTDATQRLTAWKAAIDRADVPLCTTVRSGQVAHTIVDHATATHADLIVMGTHGRTGLAHVVLGSVAERVVRTAPCPVLTVREIAVAAETVPLAAAEVFA